MATITKAYTATGNSDLLLINNKQSYTYEVTGTFVGTWIIEFTRDGDNFEEVDTGTGTKAVTTVLVDRTDSGRIFVRSRCSVYTSGTLTAITADVADNIADTEIIDDDGLSVFKAVDGGIQMAGTLAVTGVTTQTGQLNAGVLSCSGAATITGAVVHTSTTALNDDVTMADAKNLILNTSTGTQIGTASGQKLAFYGATPVNKGTALTAADAVALDATYNVTEQTTVSNMRVRLNEMEVILQDLGLVN